MKEVRGINDYFVYGGCWTPQKEYPKPWLYMYSLVRVFFSENGEELIWDTVIHKSDINELNEKFNKSHKDGMVKAIHILDFSTHKDELTAKMEYRG